MNFWAPWMLYLYWHELLKILPWHKKFLFLNNLLRMVLIFHPQGWVIWLFFGGFGLHEQRKVHYAKDREIIITIGCEHDAIWWKCFMKMFDYTKQKISKLRFFSPTIYIDNKWTSCKKLLEVTTSTRVAQGWVWDYQLHV